MTVEAKNVQYVLIQSPATCRVISAEQSPGFQEHFVPGTGKLHDIEGTYVDTADHRRNSSRNLIFDKVIGVK